MIIRITARLWYRRSYGERRHSVTITDDRGETLRVSDVWNGNWQRTAACLIEQAGWLPSRRTTVFGIKIGLRRWMAENGVELETEVIRVKRKGDL